MTELEKMRKGEYYRMDDTEINNIQTRAITLCQQFNSLSITKKKERQNLLRELLGSVGNNPQLKPGFLCDTGSNIHIGDNFITNYNVTILDMASVTIGNNVWLGPNVGIYAVAHPIDTIGRKNKLGIAKPVTIGDNVWIGGNSVVLMGVTIGKNAVIGAGSVVTKDVPENTIAVGNPARIIKYIDNKEEEYE